MSNPHPQVSAEPRPRLIHEQDLPSLPQQTRSRQKRQKLLEAALILFETHGYEAASIEEIARQAGVAVGGFYQYFRSKQQLLLVLMDRLLEELEHLDLQLDPTNDPRQSLEQLVRQGLAIDWLYAGAYRAWREVIVQDLTMADFHRQITHWSTARLVSAFQSMTQLPKARQELDVETLAQVFDVLFWQLVGMPSDNFEAIVGTISHLLYHALFHDAELST